MSDDRGPSLNGKSRRQLRSTRRGVLATATVATGLVAGCADTESEGDEESNTADADASADDEDDAGSDDDDQPSEADDTVSDDESDESSADTDDSSADDAEADDEYDLDHPSAGDMAHSPFLGPEPGTGEATVIMFDDLACPACAAFEETAFPDLQAHAEADELSIVWRGMGVIEDWSDAALQVLWATYERDEETFWELREYTFEIQDEIDDSDDLIDRLTDHLEETTSLDADAIRSEATGDEFEREVALDEDAASRAGVDATPYFFLFRGGEFRTEIRGIEDYHVFASALEL
jgi:protein-disulfide isomerase